MSIFDKDDTPFFAPRAAEVREAPGYRRPVEKPRKVMQMAAKANAMIRLLAVGDRAGALALVSEEDLKRRAKEPEKTVSPEEFARLRAAAMGRAEQDKLAAQPRVAFQGREYPLSEAIALGYQPTGREGKRDE